MSENVVYLPVDTLRRFMVDVLLSTGVPQEDAEICADVYIAADVRGIESHGVGRLKYYWERLKSGQHQPVTNFEVVRDAPAVATVDAHHGMGPVVGVRAMRLAMDKARACGVGAVAVRNSTHFGIAGYYPLMAVKAGMAGLAFTNARPACGTDLRREANAGHQPHCVWRPQPGPRDAVPVRRRYLYDLARQGGSDGTQGEAVAGGLGD